MAEQQYKAAIVLLLAVARRVQENLSGYGEAERFQELIDAVDIPTGKDRESIRRDSDRNFYMDAKEAIAYGIADEILESRP